MTDFLSYVLRGIPFGCVFALVAVGLVLTYKTSGVFNLAFGAQAYVSAAVYYDAHVRHNWPILPAFALAVIVVGPLVGLILDRAIFRFMRTAPHVARLVAVLGLLVAIPQLVNLWFGPGNAAANSIVDHLDVLDTAIGQLPTDIAAGHHPGDDPALLTRPVMVRADSAGATRGFVWGCRARNVGFAVVARKNASIHAATSQIRFDDGCWQPALTQAGDERPGAAVCEVTDHLDLAAWPAGTRLIVRREPLHPGAQQSLFPSDAYRYWGHYTDQAGDPVTLAAHMRAHAHVEDHIRRLKDSGLERFPFTHLDANRARLAIVAFAADLVRWFQLACLDGLLQVAEPKTLRWAIWHTPARLVRRARQTIVRILDDWPTAASLTRAYQRAALIT